jgi:hypothetical protein
MFRSCWSPRGHRLLGIAFLLLAIAFCSWVRIGTTLSDPNFLTDRPEGMMRSDPGLLFYMVERVVESGGLPPPDFRADPRVEHPRRVDLPRLDAVCMEYPIAWAYLLAGKGVPLHVFSLWFMSVVASLAAAGCYLLALELTGKVRWACLATALFAVTFANYRTTGFLLMREDLSIPFFALHLALLVRAARLRTAASMALCALALTVALASWHAMRFFVTLEFLCIAAWFFRTGESPFDAPRAWLLPVVAGGLSLGVPLLVRTGFLLSVPMRMAAGLLAAAVLKRRGTGRVGAAAAAVGTIAALTLVNAVTGTDGASDYNHVWELMKMKVRFLGEQPADPALLSFDARLMWGGDGGGPFATLPVGLWPVYFGVAILPAIPAFAQAVRDWFRGRGSGAEWMVISLAAVGLVNAWLVNRVQSLPALLLPVCAAIFLSRFEKRQAGAVLMAAVVAVQAICFFGTLGRYRNSWYQAPNRTYELRALLSALPALVPENEAVMADPIVSTAILAHTRRPIVLQPKWEEAEARARLRDFLFSFYHGTPDALHRLLTGKYRCRYLLVDREMLGDFRYEAGLPLARQAPDPGTAAALFLQRDPRILSAIPGYRLVYWAPSRVPPPGTGPVDGLQLYELTGLPGESRLPGGRGGPAASEK